MCPLVSAPTSLSQTDEAPNNRLTKEGKQDYDFQNLWNDQMTDYVKQQVLTIPAEGLGISAGGAIACFRKPKPTRGVAEHATVVRVKSGLVTTGSLVAIMQSRRLQAPHDWQHIFESRVIKNMMISWRRDFIQNEPTIEQHEIPNRSHDSKSKAFLRQNHGG